MSKNLYVDLAKLPSEQPATEYHDDQTIVVRGHKRDTDRMIGEKDTLDGAKKKLEQARALLEPLAKQFHEESEAAGNFARKVHFQGSERRATFSFTNTFTPLDARMKAQLVQILGPDVTEHLWEEVESTSLIRGKADELRQILRDAGKNPDEYLNTSKSLQFVSDFRLKRFNLRENLSDEQNAALDMVMDSAAARPTLTTK